MLPLQHARKRVRSFLAEINRLRESEFPYEQSKGALALIQEVAERHLESLDALTDENDIDTVINECGMTVTFLYDNLPFLGFILRSTNIRNGFEVYFPLLRLARAILGEDTKLIISSEWDYSPFIYGGIPELPGFVLIGLPAPESANPLLMPLAGHELGHSVWIKHKCKDIFATEIREKILSEIKARWTEYTILFPGDLTDADLETDLFALQTWAPAFDWAINQAEEEFCDYIGIAIFGEAYLHAFAYLLAPGMSDERPFHYPNMRRRVADMKEAATTMGVATPQSYEQCFIDMVEPDDATEREKKFLLSLADTASQSIRSQLIEKARTLILNSGFIPRSNEIIKNIVGRFELVVPAEDTRGLSNILNAGWVALNDDSFWRKTNLSEMKDTTLKELILKTIEVYEIEERTRVSR